MYRSRGPRSRTVIHIIVLIALALVGAGSSAQAETHASDPVAARALEAHERWLLGTINDYRQAHGLGRLVASGSLNRAASDWAHYPAPWEQWGHFGPNGESPFDRAQSAGWPGGYVLENIALGPTDAIVDIWRNSPTHNGAMLWSGGTSVGVGRGSDSGPEYPHWVFLIGGPCPPGEEGRCELSADTGDSSIRLAPPPKPKQDPRLRVAIRRAPGKLVVRLHALGDGWVDVCVRRLPHRRCAPGQTYWNGGPRTRYVVRARPGRWRAVVTYEAEGRWLSARRTTPTIRVR